MMLECNLKLVYQVVLLAMLAKVIVNLRTARDWAVWMTILESG